VPLADAATTRNRSRSTQKVRTRWARANSPAERRQTAAEARRERIRRLVDAAPPVTVEQAAELRRLLDAANQLERALPQPVAA